MDTFSLSYPIWTLVLSPVIGLIFTALLYWRDSRLGDLSKFLRWFLSSLRFLSISILVFLLLGPLLSYLQREIEPPVIVVGIDNSQSISLGPDSTKSMAAARGLGALLTSALGQDFEILTYTFGQDVNGSSTPNFSEPLSDISAFFESLKGRYANRNLGAVVLASDGIYNRGSNPRYALGGLNAPMYVMALGDTARRNDALIAEVAANRFAFLGNKFPIEARLQAIKLDGQTLTYSISKGDRVVQSESFKVIGNDFEKTVRFLIDAEVIGPQRYTVAIANISGEVSTANNQRAVFIDVIDSRQKVLILAKSPHPDLFALRQSISANDNYEVELDFESTFRGSLAGYDLIVLHQIPSSETSNLLRTSLLQAKTSIFAVIGSQTDYQKLASFNLGVSLNTRGSGTNDAAPIVNSSFSLFQVDDETKTFFRDAPPVRMPFGTWNTSKGLTALLHQRIGQIETSDPLLLVGRMGDRKSAILLGEGLWRWRLYDFARNESHERFDRLMNSLVQYLSVKDDKRQFRVEFPAEVMENQAIIMRAELYNDALELANDPEVNIVITNEDGKDFPFVFSRHNTAYRLDVGALPVGNYSFHAVVTRDGSQFQDKGTFTVRPFALESRSLRANHAILEALAQNTQGAVFYPGEESEIASAIRSSGSMQPVSFTTEILKPFLNFKWPFFLILLLLSLEWFVRKRSGHY